MENPNPTNIPDWEIEIDRLKNENKKLRSELRKFRNDPPLIVSPADLFEELRSSMMDCEDNCGVNCGCQEVQLMKIARAFHENMRTAAENETNCHLKMIEAHMNTCDPFKPGCCGLRLTAAIRVDRLGRI